MWLVLCARSCSVDSVPKARLAAVKQCQDAVETPVVVVSAIDLEASC